MKRIESLKKPVGIPNGEASAEPREATRAEDGKMETSDTCRYLRSV
jgi:hypothetical protein